jgi:hypothetical protein
MFSLPAGTPCWCDDCSCGCGVVWCGPCCGVTNGVPERIYGKLRYTFQTQLVYCKFLNILENITISHYSAQWNSCIWERWSLYRASTHNFRWNFARHYNFLCKQWNINGSLEVFPAGAGRIRDAHRKSSGSPKSSWRFDQTSTKQVQNNNVIIKTFRGRWNNNN